MKLFCLMCAVASHLVVSFCQQPSSAMLLCREPTNVTEMYRVLRSNAIKTAAISQEEPYTSNNQHQQVIVTTINDTCHNSYGHSRTCNCPVRQELNFDVTRIPKALVQSSCCSESTDTTTEWITRCKEVYHSVRVLRRSGCSEGVFRYILEWERVPVGCSCHVISNVVSAP